MMQPPSGGCVLKHQILQIKRIKKMQPPSGGCVLKPLLCFLFAISKAQPPSGGCVLKLKLNKHHNFLKHAATFGWLCVETHFIRCIDKKAVGAATFGWLCVETVSLAS